jgi:hypothetical protein
MKKATPLGWQRKTEHSGIGFLIPEQVAFFIGIRTNIPWAAALFFACLH